MKLSSKAFSNGGSIPSLFTCEGKDINPALDISEVPEEAKSLALIVDDPDVPERVRKDRLWVHWVVYNIDPKTVKIAENAPPFAKFGKNSDQQKEYMGPCPPDGEHRYFFKLYALDTLLELPEGATKEELLHAMEGHILAKAELMGRYNKIANRIS